MQTDLFEIIWERMAILLGLRHDFVNSCSKNLSLDIFGFGFLVLSSSRGEKWLGRDVTRP